MCEGGSEVIRRFVQARFAREDPREWMTRTRVNKETFVKEHEKMTSVDQDDNRDNLLNENAKKTCERGTLVCGKVRDRDGETLRATPLSVERS